MSTITRRVVSRLSRNARAFQAVRASSSSSGSVASTTEDQAASVPARPQAPNAPAVWSTSQRTRAAATTGARFEQANMELQPQPLSAMAMIAEEPVRIVHGRKAVCDGGSGPLGHPKIFINLDKPGPTPCGYCGIRFEQAPHHGH